MINCILNPLKQLRLDQERGTIEFLAKLSEQSLVLPLLIVNADDFGRSRVATDRAIACLAAGRISSASAMVYMADSQRARDAARNIGLNVGLHLNLTEAFSRDDVPLELKHAHDAVRSFLKASKFSLLLFNPYLTRQFEYVVRAQLDEFVRLFGCEPTHIDGHQHMHLATNVLIQRLLPARTKVRRSFSFRAREKNPVNRGYRMCVDWTLKRRHYIVDYFFSLSHVQTVEQLGAVVALARDTNVELMAHPERDGEFSFLMSDSYATAVSAVKIGGYDALEG